LAVLEQIIVVRDRDFPIGIPYWLFQCFVLGNGSSVFTPGAANKVNINGHEVVKGLRTGSSISSCWPGTTLFVTTIAVVNAFETVDQVYIMTGGCPNNATNMLLFDLWQTLFSFNDYGRIPGSKSNMRRSVEGRKPIPTVPDIKASHEFG
jgi:hypothetical protein